MGAGLTVTIEILGENLPSELVPDDDVYVNAVDIRLDRSAGVQAIQIDYDADGERAQLEFGLPKERGADPLAEMWRELKVLELLALGYEARLDEY
ncbi:MAG: hypothetical protein QXE79_07095 [Candidatus Bathyarchaeia archaeon]